MQLIDDIEAQVAINGESFRGPLLREAWPRIKAALLAGKEMRQLLWEARAPQTASPLAAPPAAAAMTLTAREIAKRLSCSAALLLLSGCTFSHDPARDGIWIVKPAQMVRCQQTPEGVVCGSVRAIRVEDVGI